MRILFPDHLIFLAFLLIVTVWFSSWLYQQSAAEMFAADVTETDEFRQMRMTESALNDLLGALGAGGLTPGEILATLYPFYTDGFRSFAVRTDADGLGALRKSFLNRNRSGYLSVMEAYRSIWDDVQCFPAAGGNFSFENTWMFERTYGGTRGHEGTDVMPPADLAGVYPVVSMTDGIVEKTGWLEKGGYRIGIRADHGGYFYYAHLDSYARDFEVGDAVSAGEQLGMMGDSGYGPEGTKGKFDVHLHLGIYIRTEHAEEMSVNPYWVLCYSFNL